MGGHFLSDNIFAMIFMIYLAIIYKYLVFLNLKKMFKILVITDGKLSSLNQCNSIINELKIAKKIKLRYIKIKKSFFIFFQILYLFKTFISAIFWMEY